MNYQKSYNLLVERALNRSLVERTEAHHIVPRCLGGADSRDNICYLTPREHFVAHQLLAKLYPEHPGVNLALYLMTTGAGGHRLNNRSFSWFRKRAAEASSKLNKGRRHTIETRAKWSAQRKGQVPVNKGVPHTDEHKLKISTTLKERYLQMEHPLKGRPSPHVGKIRGPNSKKMKPKQTLVCEHCGKQVVGPSNYYRWHHDNCPKIELV